MTERTHLEAAETAISATNQNVNAGQVEGAQITALVAIAHAVLALRDEVYLASLPPDHR